MKGSVTAYCLITNDSILLNGNRTRLDQIPAEELLSRLYKELNIEYPKFYKMDNLSKLGIIGVEKLSELSPQLNDYNDDDVALLFMNRDSSYDADIKHLSTLDEGRNPSPAVFVYTLPNIVMGELSILKKWYGENLFILVDSFNLKEWISEAELMFESKKAKAVLGGWINVFDGQIDLRLYLVEQRTDSKSYKIEDLIDY